MTLNSFQLCDRTIASKRIFPGQDFVKNNTKSKNVTSSINIRSECLFG